MALEVNHGESPDTARVAGSIQVNDRVAEPEMTLILGTATDIQLDGADGVDAFQHVVVELTGVPIPGLEFRHG